VRVLVAAMEQSLRRLFARFHFPFHQIGPSVDYYGPVAPFLLDLDELDGALYEKAPWLLAEFYEGLDSLDLDAVALTANRVSACSSFVREATTS
jgi:hypothetical protein